MRTDSHNNPTAFTTAVAHAGGLVLGVDYTQGDSFTYRDGLGVPHTLYTARLIGDPIAQTIRVIDKAGYYTKPFGAQRWSYIAIPNFDWAGKTFEQKRDIIGYQYQRESGIAMRGLFPNYGKA